MNALFSQPDCWEISGQSPVYHHAWAVACGGTRAGVGCRGDHDRPARAGDSVVEVAERKDRPMIALSLDAARRILDAALAKTTELKLNKPVAVAVLDARGCLKAFAAQDGTSLMRADVAHGKAYGALALGMGSRAIFKRAQEQAYFVDAVNTLARGQIVPVPGGVLMHDQDGKLAGAVGISGDSSDNDEACASAGIAAVGLKPSTG
jgi:uncharacterized protein GlcG (DUF336 family)